MKKEEEFKRKTLEDRVGRENQTWHFNESSKRKSSNETEQILQIVSQAHFPEVGNNLKLYI